MGRMNTKMSPGRSGPAHKRPDELRGTAARDATLPESCSPFSSGSLRAMRECQAVILNILSILSILSGSSRISHFASRNQDTLGGECGYRRSSHDSSAGWRSM